jgi:hypothetical protein
MLGNLLPGPTVVYESLRSGTGPWRLKAKGVCMFKVVREIYEVLHIQLSDTPPGTLNWPFDF